MVSRGAEEGKSARTGNTNCELRGLYGFIARSSQLAVRSPFTLTALPPAPPRAFVGDRHQWRRTGGIAAERQGRAWARARRSGRRRRVRLAWSWKRPRSTNVQPCRRTGARCLTIDWEDSGMWDGACSERARWAECSQGVRSRGQESGAGVGSRAATLSRP